MFIIFAAGLALGILLGGVGLCALIWMYESVTWEQE
jgi:hypothetical protein